MTADYRLPNNQKAFKLAEILEVSGFDLHVKEESFMIDYSEETGGPQRGIRWW